jgi:MFS family permease
MAYAVATLRGVTESLGAPLQLRRFRALWLASVFSNLGGFLQSVAASWLMLELTGSPAWVAAMAASTTLPLLFLSLPAGAAADLANRRNVLLSAQVAMLAAVAAMSILDLLDATTPELLLGLGLVLGIGVAMNAPVWQAMVPDLVPRQLVASAVALNSISFNAARAVGPALGGAIVVVAGPGTAFAINAVTYVLVVAVVASFPASDWKPEDEASFTRAITLGIRYTRFTPALLWLLGMSAGFAITSAALQVLLPNLTQDRLGAGAGMYGLLLGAMGIGALAGGMSRARIGERLGGHTAAFGIGLYGAAGVGTGFVTEPWAVAVLMAVAGAAWVWTLATLNTTIQALSHPWVRGRTMSLYMLAFSGVYPLGSLLAGAIGDGVDVHWAIAGLSAAAVLLGAAAWQMPIIGVDEVAPSEPAVDWDPTPHGDTELEGGPVMVLNTWMIEEDRLAEFLEALAELRLVRLRTGAYRWRLYRNADDPRRMTEAFNVASWEDHLLQHQRIDAAAAEAIRRARSFDVADGPTSRHLVAFEVVDPKHRPDWVHLALQHRDAHAEDGSIPLLSIVPDTDTEV